MSAGKSRAPISNGVAEFDLTPNPRILAMLGEINLTQWRCIAELVDNSVDGFLKAQRQATPIGHPQVSVSIPMTDNESAKITVRDNGPGMDDGTLQNAVRAGWTGNSPAFDSLGFYGMGLKIAVARLGTLTKVWTTRAGDQEWVGVEIDFAMLQRQGHFKTPRLTRPKADPKEHGSEVSIERLKPDQRSWFARPASRTEINKQLQRVYSSLLRHNGFPLAFNLLVNGKKLDARNHCVWGGENSESRNVDTTRYGRIDAFQPFDVRLPSRPHCNKCIQWLAAGESQCSSCGTADAVASRERRISGWLGIQRYLSATDYGLDFIRHGRKIELANKDLFYWIEDDRPEKEYPIDDPRDRGRIVGEVHVDHCRVTYTKDRFDRNDPAWEELVKVVRGDGPLRPDKASQLGHGQNVSPMFLLFQAFRRSNPHKEVAGVYKKLLVVKDNERAEEMAKHFYANEPDYQSDQKWFELIEETDNLLLVSNSPGGAGHGTGLQGFPTPQAGAAGTTIPAQPSPAPPVRNRVSSLTREYRDDATNQRWDIRALSVSTSDPELSNGQAWKLRAQPAGYHEFFINLDHVVFRSVTLTPLDALLAELAWSAMDFERGHPTGATFSRILSQLREKYADANKLDAVHLSGLAGQVLGEIARGVIEKVKPEDARALFGELSPRDQEATMHRMATRSVRNPQEAIAEGKFLEFAPRKTLLGVFDDHPEFFFDGKCWDDPYIVLDYGSPAATEEARSQLVRYYSSLLTDAIWLAEQDPTDLERASRAKLLRAAMAIELLTGDTASEA